jgi:hypothetical protein
VLTNTADTNPAVYVWTDVGQDVVGDATPGYAGVAKLYNGVLGENTDGSVIQAALNAMYNSLVDTDAIKLDLAGGPLAGKVTVRENPDVSPQIRNISAGTSAMVAGETALASGARRAR